VREDFYGEIAKHVAEPGSGATVSMQTGQPVTSGWATAQAGHEHVEPSQTFSEDSLKRYAGANREPLEQAGYMGLWHAEGGRGAGVYHDVTEVRPNTYRGGVESIARGYQQNQDAVFNIDRMQELSMRPKNRAEQRGTRAAMRSLRAQRPASVGPETTISQMSPEALGAALRGRRTIQEGR